MSFWVELREWMSALSGWVGAAGALLAARWTIGKMTQQLTSAQQQIDEARRQTDFVLGDALPDFSVRHRRTQHDDLGLVEVVVANWNRRDSWIIDLEDVANSDFRIAQISIQQAPGLGPVVGWSPRSERAFPQAVIPGWKNRCEPPAEITILVQTSFVPDRVGVFQMAIHGRIEDAIGTTFRRVVAIAHPLKIA